LFVLFNNPRDLDLEEGKKKRKERKQKKQGKKEKSRMNGGVPFYSDLADPGFWLTECEDAKGCYLKQWHGM